MISWVPAGQSVEVAGQVIPGGMLYVGSGAPGENGYGIEPALVDPSLPVAWDRRDQAGAHMGYWPSYSEINPFERAGYLWWHLTGRVAPDTYIGYVFLYFYGLERRLLVDLGVNCDHPEARAIADEVRRLLAVYGDNHSFRSYATGFVDLIDLTTSHAAALTPPDWKRAARGWQVPVGVRVALGRYAEAKSPIPAEWALALVRLHPEMYLRTPATRCTAEFDELFLLRYRDRHGEGIVVKALQRRIEVEYHPASRGLRGVRHRLHDVSDICDSKPLIDKLRDVASECTDALDAYSRYMGRNPDDEDGPAAVGLLPDELLATRTGPALDALRSWATEVTDGHTQIGIDYVVGRWSPGRAEKLTKRDAVSLASLLAKLGVGIEPDVRFGSKTPAPGTTAVVFALPPDAPAAPSPRYAAASVLVHLTAVVASADGSVHDEERLHLTRHLEASLALDAPECARLEAHFAWLTSATPGLAGVKKRLDELTAVQRGAIGRFLVDLAAADGDISASEITTLTKLYKLLGLDEADVYSAVHAVSTRHRGPVTVRQADTETRHTIPAPTPERTGVALDQATIDARLAETAEVTALLADIFTDDEPVSAPAAGAETPEVDGPTVEGLDAAHSALADRLRGQATWEMADAETVAADLGLPMLSGALDRINEAAMDLCGEPLIDGDDPLETNDYAAQEIFG